MLCRSASLWIPLGLALLLQAPGPAQTPGATLEVSPGALRLTGGQLDFVVQGGPGLVQHGYVILGSLSGTRPGSQLGKVLLPLNYDYFTTALLHLMNTPVFPGGAGILDWRGEGRATLDLKGPIDPALKGATLDFSAVVIHFGRAEIVLATAPVDVGVDRFGKVTETFATTAMRDRKATGALWGGGTLTTGVLGGTGVLGDFDPTKGSTVQKGVYVFDTGNTTIPGECTLTGKPIKVTDGVFHFVGFTIPQGIKVRFVGPVPARIYALGSIEIAGELDVSGGDSTSAMYNSASNEKGHPGSLGGPGGASGGKGGGEPGSGETPQGKDGSDLVVPAGHPAYGKVAGTGGKGSPEFPAALNPALIKLDYFSFFSIQQSAPGGPGGYVTQGSLGSIKVVSPQYATTHGPPVTLSKALLPLPLNPTLPVIDQLLIGGSGGGGGGVSPYGSMVSQTDWQRGTGGGGGGGALALRCGYRLVGLSTGAILAHGGNGSGDLTSGILNIGGNGSGGTVLVQAADTVQYAGSMDLGGGVSKAYGDTFFTHYIHTAVGGDGFLRIEATTPPSLTSLSGVKPAPTATNLGLLTDQDLQTGARSGWYKLPTTGAIPAHYGLDVRVSTIKATFTDDPRAPNPTHLGSTVAAIFFQGARLDSQGGPLPGTLTRWTEKVADLADPVFVGGKDLPDAIRWVVILDKAVSSGNQVTVEEVRLYYFY